MKRRYMRAIGFLLSLVLACGTMPLSALADYVTENDLVIPERITGRIVNPRYGDAGLLRGEERTFDTDVVPGFEGQYHSDVEAATAEVRQAMKERKGIIDVGYQTAESEDGEALITAIWEDAYAHTGVPTEGDYLGNAWYEVVYDVSSETVDGVTRYVFTYIPSYFTTSEQEGEVDAAVAALLAELSLDGKTDYEKVRGAYNWVCDNVDYDYGNLEDSTYLLKHSAYAALIDRKAVCQGYAVLLYRLLLELGVDCRVISGYSGDERHAWNIIGLDGAYYNADPTWDEGLSVFPRYFLCMESNFPGHTRDSEFDTPDFHAAYPMSPTPYVIHAAASGTTGKGIEWVLDGETGILTISGTGAIPDYANQGAPWFPYADSISAIMITEGITEVGDCSFSRCRNVTSVALPGTLTRIGDSAFSNCRSLTAIELHEGITVIEHSAFGECISLTELTLPSTVTTYGSSVFSNCDGLKRVTFAEGTTFIPSSMFYNCDSLQYMTIPETVTEIDDTVFRNCDALEEVYVPASVVTLGAAVFSNCKSLKNITVAEGNPSYADVDGVLFSKDLKQLHCYPAGRAGAYAIPEGTETVVYGSFCEAVKLTNVTFPDSVKTIDRYAFTWCHSLTDVVIGDGVETIGDYGFGNCDNLRSVHLGSSIRELEGAFRYFSMSGTSKLKTVYFTGNAPVMDKYTFYKDITATCYYPAGNKTWTEEVLQNYGGILTWVPFDACNGMHSYEAEVFPATCEESGYTEYCCTVCGTSYQDNFTDPLGHSYEFMFTAEPTCSEGGYSFYSCTTCGASYMDDWVNPLPHTYETYVYPPNCIEGGFTEYYCTVCGFCYIDDFTEPGEHYYETMVTEPTCMEDGFSEYICIYCGDWYVDDYTDRIEHDYEAVVTPPTDEEEGYTTYTCTMCGDSYIGDYVDPVEHNFGEWYVVTEATCTENGEERRDCTNCDHYESRTIEPVAHTYESVVTPPTYDAQGYTTHTCTVCGHSYVDNYVDALIHHEVLEGDGTEWSGDSEMPLAIRADADIAKFVEVRLNGVLLEPENYTVTEGSTIVTLKPEYLATLPAGEYTMEIIFTDGNAEATFRITGTVAFGDLNGDGEVDIFDANLIVAFYNGTADLSAEQQLAADVNGDGEVDIFDANLVVSYYNGTIDKFPIEE